MKTQAPWTEPESVLTAAPGSSEPALAILAGVPHLVWTCDGVLYHSARGAGGWGPAVQVTSGCQPALVGTTDGRLHCLFANQFAGNYEIYYTTWDGNKWALPQNVSRTDGASTYPAAAVAPDGRQLHATWADATPGQSTIYFGQPGKTFWTSIPVPQGRGQSPVICPAQTGEVYVAWQDRVQATGNYDIFCCRHHQGTWTLPEAVSDNPNGHSLHPHFAIQPEGQPQIVWQDARGRAYQVQYSERLASGWSEPQPLSPEGVDCFLPRIVTGGKDGTNVLWVQGMQIMQRQRPAANAQWPQPEPVVLECPDVVALSVAADPEGSLHVAWVSTDDYGTPHLWYASRPAQAISLV